MFPLALIEILFGFIGALFGAGVSLFGIVYQGKKQAEQRHEERSNTLDDRLREQQEGIFVRSTVATAEAFALLNEIAPLANGAGLAAGALISVRERWGKVRDELLIIGSTHDVKEIGEEAIRLVGRLGRIFNAIETPSSIPNSEEIIDGIEETTNLLNRYRKAKGLSDLFRDPTPDSTP